MTFSVSLSGSSTAADCTYGDTARAAVEEFLLEVHEACDRLRATGLVTVSGSAWAFGTTKTL